jgi:hypothetical protein
VTNKVVTRTQSENEDKERALKSAQQGLSSMLLYTTNIRARKKKAERKSA